MRRMVQYTESKSGRITRLTIWERSLDTRPISWAMRASASGTRLSMCFIL